MAPGSWTGLGRCDDETMWMTTTQGDGQTDRTKLDTDGSMANRWREDERKKDISAERCAEGGAEKRWKWCGTQSDYDKRSPLQRSLSTGVSASALLFLQRSHPSRCSSAKLLAAVFLFSVQWLQRPEGCTRASPLKQFHSLLHRPKSFVLGNLAVVLTDVQV